MSNRGISVWVWLMGACLLVSATAIGIAIRDWLKARVKAESFGKASLMKTISGILLALPSLFFVLIFIYNPLDIWWVPVLFAILSLLSAVACLVWAWIIWHRSPSLACACLAVGFIYVLLFAVPLLTPRAKTRRASAEPVGVGITVLFYGRRRPAV